MIATDELREALMSANRRTLAAVVAHLSGDPSIVPSSRDREALVEVAIPVIEPYLRGEREVAPPSDEVLHAAMELAAGEPVDPAYRPLVREHMNLGDATSRPQPLAAPEGFSVMIIGSGVSGVAAGITLKRLGFDDFTIIEASDGPGGTWRQNTYPGCRVDSPSFLYSFSFEPGYPWPEHFSRQPTLREYVETIVEKYDLTPHIRYRTTVESLAWDDEAGEWVVGLRTADGTPEETRCNFVIGALGLLRVPRLPDIEGRDSFAGPAFHSSEWDHDVDLAGKRVGVIGTGASANQIVPAIQPIVDRVTVFQRSAQWAIEHPKHDKYITGTERTLMREIPAYAAWYRFHEFWALGDRAFQLLKIDPEWSGHEHSVSEVSEVFRQQLMELIETKLEGHPDLIAKSTPTYPPFGKRMLIDNGWFDALKQRNVDLDTDRIVRIVPEGIETTEGLVELDVIVYATGFRADLVLWPIEIAGKGGVDVRARLDEDPEAYLGVAVEDCPNLMIISGPNATPGYAGNGMFYAECQVSYITKCLRALFESGNTVIEPKAEAVREWTEGIVRDMSTTVWGLAGFDNWYRGPRDRVTTILPRRILDFWIDSSDPNLDAYVMSRRAHDAVPAGVGER